MSLGEPIEIDMEKPSAMYDQRELNGVKNAVTNIIETHWQGILHGISESESRVGGVSISIKLDHRGNMSRHIKQELVMQSGQQMNLKQSSKIQCNRNWEYEYKK